MFTIGERGGGGDSGCRGNKETAAVSQQVFATAAAGVAIKPGCTQYPHAWARVPGLLSKFDRQQLCGIRIDPQSPCICLQQACSALVIDPAGTAHTIDGANTDRVRRTAHNARLNRYILNSE